MTRVLHVIPSVAPRYGGPSTAIWPMARALREIEGIRVEIATTDADGARGRMTTAEMPEGGRGVHLFPCDWSGGWKYSRALNRWLSAHAKEYDVIHVHSTWNDPTAAACRAGRRGHVPYIIRPCGMLSDYTWRRSKWKKRVYWWLREKRNVQSAAGLHVTSKDEFHEVARLGVTAPIEVIPLGIADEAWDAPIEPDWLREQCPQAGRRPIVLFLSRIHPKKGITDLLLPALAQLQADVFLAIIGGPDEHAKNYGQAVADEIRRLNLIDRVELVGAVPPERRWAAFDGADVFVLPSHSENFGIVVAEAMARGKPVVVTTGVQFQEHVAAAQSGVVVRPDAGELATALEELLSDPMRRARMGESGREYIRSHLSWQQTAKKLADFYDRVRKTANQSREKNGQ